MKNKSYKNRYLPQLSELSKKQSDELISINEALKKQLKIIGLRTIKGSIGKRKNGYTFERDCCHCRASVNLKIDLINGKNTISFDERCKKH